ncbi:hypothetical protein [Virgibacillus sp. SK37]|uniref:hypothetical protein n=1 Tax=Virgibacillus sp. SK37 TaxID=403957 RepID=UPI0004D1987F|nr:hypothetical protein [Virgibacillus sp. SK37]AIF45407.1 hypothetical protein X953_10010 [Virgibacillus sp. SK37]
MGEKIMEKREPTNPIVKERIKFEESLNEGDRFLYELIYQASQKSNNHHYKGTYPLYRQIIESQDEIIKRLDSIELSLKSGLKKPKIPKIEIDWLES